MSEQHKNPSTIETRSQARRSLPGRLGCGVVLILWFGLILTPCLCIVLATQGEIAVQLGEPPGNFLRVWLVNEARERGIGISSPTISNASTGEVCVQTHINFLFWQGEGKPTHYCECYAHEQDTSTWTLIGTPSEVCP